MKKILVTGADGFIGSHLVEKLVECTYRVTALVHYNSVGSWGWLDHSPVKDRIEIVMGDIRDPWQMLRLMDGKEWVFHLAGLIGIPYSYQAPYSYVETNTLGTINLLEAAKRVGIERFVHTSTSEVYGTAQSVPITEDHRLHAQSPYAASKIGADQLAQSFYLTYKLPVVIARPFNTYGPRQSARAVIPQIMSQIANTDPLETVKLKLGNLQSTRDFTYVSDTVDGLMAAAWTKKGVGGTFNLGTKTETDIYGLAQTISEVCDRLVTIETDEERLRPGDSEVERLVSETYLARMTIGYLPHIELRDGLKKTWDWFKENKHLYKLGYQT